MKYLESKTGKTISKFLLTITTVVIFFLKDIFKLVRDTRKVL